MKHTEAVVYALVEILHSILCYDYSCFQYNQTNIISKYYLDFLLCEDISISYTTKFALSKGLKPLIGKHIYNLIQEDNTYKESKEGNISK